VVESVLFLKTVLRRGQSTEIRKLTIRRAQERLFKKIIIMNLREPFKRLLKNLCKELLLWLSLPM
jgi:hypothetical protein